VLPGIDFLISWMNASSFAGSLSKARRMTLVSFSASVSSRSVAPDWSIATDRRKHRARQKGEGPVVHSSVLPSPLMMFTDPSSLNVRNAPGLPHVPEAHTGVPLLS